MLINRNLFFYCIISTMKDLFKELGKLLYDIVKILLAVAVVTPYIKNEPTPIIVIQFIIILVVLGSILIFLGGEKWKKQ